MLMVIFHLKSARENPYHPKIFRPSATDWHYLVHKYVSANKMKAIPCLLLSKTTWKPQITPQSAWLNPYPRSQLLKTAIFVTKGNFHACSNLQIMVRNKPNFDEVRSATFVVTKQPSLCNVSTLKCLLRFDKYLSGSRQMISIILWWEWHYQDVYVTRLRGALSSALDHSHWGVDVYARQHLIIKNSVEDHRAVERQAQYKKELFRQKRRAKHVYTNFSIFALKTIYSNGANVICM